MTLVLYNPKTEELNTCDDEPIIKMIMPLGMWGPMIYLPPISQIHLFIQKGWEVVGEL